MLVAVVAMVHEVPQLHGVEGMRVGVTITKAQPGHANSAKRCSTSSAGPQKKARQIPRTASVSIRLNRHGIFNTLVVPASALRSL